MGGDDQLSARPPVSRPGPPEPSAAAGEGEEFRLRSVAVVAFGPATLFGLAEGAMLMAAAVAVIGLILCLVNLGHGALSLVVFGLGVLLLGAASSVYTLARQSYLTESVPPHLRARALSTLGGVLRIGMFAGPFLGAGAEEVWGLPDAYYVSLAAMAAAAVIVWRVPDLEKSDQVRAAAAQVTTKGILKQYWRTFLTLGMGVVLLSAIRQTRQVVIPLWAAHIGLSP